MQATLTRIVAEAGYAIISVDSQGAIVYLTRSRTRLSRNPNHAFLFQSADVGRQLVASLTGFGTHPLAGREDLTDVVPHCVRRRVSTGDGAAAGRTKVRFPIYRRDARDGAALYRFERPNDDNHSWRHVCTINAPNGTVIKRPSPDAQRHLKVAGRRGVWLLAADAYRAAMNRDHGLELAP